MPPHIVQLAPPLKLMARAIFERTMAEVDVGRAVRRNLSVNASKIQVGSACFDLADLAEIVIVAIGKAAAPMYEAAAAVLQEAPGFRMPVEAMVVSPSAPRQGAGPVSYFAGAHPLPDESSRSAARAILDRLGRAHARTLVLFLVSGGSSAMVEMPLDLAISVADNAEFNRLLVGSGLPITAMNVLRKHLSAVKGGRLALAAAPAAQATLLVSDVPAGALDTVGSGPTMPDASSREECLALYRKLRATTSLPRSIEALFNSGTLPETPQRGPTAFARASWTCILSSDDLASSAARIAEALRLHVTIDNGCDDWPAEDAARYLLSRSAELRQRHGRTCLISAGEVAVNLPPTSGRGGRNQHFCLLSALQLAGSGDGTAVLSAGSDGIDGRSPAAGAVVDGTTCGRAEQMGFDPEATLAAFDSFTLLDELGDTLRTGPTGNNLRDLRILLT